MIVSEQFKGDCSGSSFGGIALYLIGTHVHQKLVAMFTHQSGESFSQGPSLRALKKRGPKLVNSLRSSGHDKSHNAPSPISSFLSDAQAHFSTR
jgi:hypothetical protein